MGQKVEWFMLVYLYLTYLDIYTTVGISNWTRVISSSLVSTFVLLQLQDLRINQRCEVAKQKWWNPPGQPLNGCHIFDLIQTLPVTWPQVAIPCHPVVKNLYRQMMWKQCIEDKNQSGTTVGNCDSFKPSRLKSIDWGLQLGSEMRRVPLPVIGTKVPLGLRTDRLPAARPGRDVHTSWGWWSWPVPSPWQTCGHPVLDDWGTTFGPS